MRGTTGRLYMGVLRMIPVFWPLVFNFINGTFSMKFELFLPSNQEAAILFNKLPSILDSMVF